MKNVSLVQLLLVIIFVLLSSSILFIGLKKEQTVGTTADTGNVARNTVSITASFYPLAEFAQQVGREKVKVHNLTPAGTEPHSFEPLPQDLITLHQSQLIIYNGIGFEPWVPKLSSEFSPEKMVAATHGISLLVATEDGHQEEYSAEEETEDHQYDPHVWLDPVLASQQVENIAQALIQVDPVHADDYRQRAALYQQQLSQLDQEFREGLANCQQNNVVTSHNALQYLAHRYNFEVLSISGISPDEEPSAQQLGKVAQFIKDHQVKYIFFESLVSPKLADTLARETQTQTLVFHTIEGLTAEEASQGEDYLSLQRQNLAALRTALECK